MKVSELAARKILDEIKQEQGKIIFPIDPFKILKSKKALITFSDFDKLEGLLLYDKNNSVVSINKNRPIKRQRFTAAHELGHLVLHSKIEQEKFLCPIYGRKNIIEKEADLFASYLLMPTDELNKLIDKYQDEKGKVGLDDCLFISEYFGVSFESCVKTICFRTKRFIENANNERLNQLIANYHPDKKRKELLNNSSDLNLLTNSIEYSIFEKMDIYNIIGIRFVQQLVHHDSHLENITLPQEEINGIFADLRYHGRLSKYCSSKNSEVIEVIGNLDMNEYCLTTNDELSIFKIRDLNKMLYKYAPFPDMAGTYRKMDNIILRGGIQPVSYIFLMRKLDELEESIKIIVKNIDKYTIAEYIDIITTIHYQLTILHPFNNGNGRTARAFLNWMLRLKNLPPIYIDSNNKKDYLNALNEIDDGGKNKNLQIVIIKAIINTMSILHESWR